MIGILCFLYLLFQKAEKVRQSMHPESRPPGTRRPSPRGSTSPTSLSATESTTWSCLVNSGAWRMQRSSTRAPNVVDSSPWPGSRTRMWQLARLRLHGTIVDGKIIEVNLSKWKNCWYSRGGRMNKSANVKQKIEQNQIKVKPDLSKTPAKVGQTWEHTIRVKTDYYSFFLLSIACPGSRPLRWMIWGPSSRRTSLTRRMMPQTVRRKLPRRAVLKKSMQAVLSPLQLLAPKTRAPQSQSKTMRKFQVHLHQEINPPGNLLARTMTGFPLQRKKIQVKRSAPLLRSSGCLGIKNACKRQENS